MCKEIEKNKFCCNKTPIFLEDVDMEKVLVSNKIFFGKKNFTGLLVFYSLLVLVIGLLVLYWLLV